MKMSDMKIKTTWLLSAGLMLGLAALSVSCAIIEPPNAPIPVAIISPPNIPHRQEGRGDCRLCHATGVGGAPQFPVADHSRRPSDVCLDCHRPAPGLYAANETIPWPTPVFPSGTTPTSGTTPPAITTPVPVSGKDLFAAKCAACHGVNRQGTPGFAPALTPDNLAKLNDADITDTISNGRTGTAMPPFKGSLTTDQIAALVQFVKSPLP
jgi:mono/diheme cytochrome c family protein